MVNILAAVFRLLPAESHRTWEICSIGNTPLVQEIPPCYVNFMATPFAWSDSFPKF